MLCLRCEEREALLTQQDVCAPCLEDERQYYWEQARDAQRDNQLEYEPELHRDGGEW